MVSLHRTTEGLDISLKGKYRVTVDASDGELDSYTVLEVQLQFYFSTYKHVSSESQHQQCFYFLFCLQIFTVDETFRVELEFSLSVAEVEQTQDAIRRCRKQKSFWPNICHVILSCSQTCCFLDFLRALMDATDTVVEIVSIKPKDSEAR